MLDSVKQFLKMPVLNQSKKLTVIIIRECFPEQRVLLVKEKMYQDKILPSCIWVSLELYMAPYSSNLAWKIPWTEEPGRLQSMGSQRVGLDWSTSLSLSCIGKGNGNPLQCSCLKNPRDRSLVGCCLWGHTGLDTTEHTHTRSMLLMNSKFHKLEVDLLDVER